ncbi:MAG TPA: hypothetical protein VK395_35290 [Gemmataceae bacterium]|nr:hypothetical protein [Gemmataceae bacterium]
MKAVEFQTQLSANQTLAVPASIAGRIPVGRQVRVLVLVPEDETAQEWEQLAAQDFGQGYADSDAIYDKLSGR